MKLPLFLALAMFGTLNACSQGASPTSNLQGFNIDGVIQIRSLSSGKCLDIDGQSYNAGARIHQWDCHGGNSQAFRIIGSTVGSPWFRLQSLHSGKCIDLASSDGGGNGSGLQQWDCNDGPHQMLKFYGTSPQSAVLQIYLGGRVLDSENNNNGTQLKVYDHHGRDNQRFDLMDR